MDYIKVDDNKMKTESINETVYDYSELLAKKQSLENSKQYSADRFDVQIAEVDALIAECVKLKLVKPIVAIKEIIK